MGGGHTGLHPFFWPFSGDPLLLVLAPVRGLDGSATATAPGTQAGSTWDEGDPCPLRLLPGRALTPEGPGRAFPSLRFRSRRRNEPLISLGRRGGSGASGPPEQGGPSEEGPPLFFCSLKHASRGFRTGVRRERGQEDTPRRGDSRGEAPPPSSHPALSPWPSRPRPHLLPPPGPQGFGGASLGGGSEADELYGPSPQNAHMPPKLFRGSFQRVIPD